MRPSYQLNGGERHGTHTIESAKEGQEYETGEDYYLFFLMMNWKTQIRINNSMATD